MKCFIFLWCPVYQVIFSWFMFSAFYLNLPKLTRIAIKFSSRSSIIFIMFSRSVRSNSLWPHRLQHIMLSCPIPTPRACSNPCLSSHGCHPTISSSVVPFSSCLQSFPASGSFPMSQFFASGGQSIRASSWALVPPMNIQDWFPLGLTGWISLQSKGLSRVFSNTTAQKHQFFSIQFLYGPTLTSIYDYWKNNNFDYMDFVSKVMSLIFNMLSRLVINFLPRNKCLLISWLQSSSAVILEPPPQNKVCHCFHCFHIYLPQSDGTDAMILVLWILSFMPTFSLSSFTFFQRLFSSSLSAIRVVSSAYLRLLIFLLAILIPACVSSSLVFWMMYSAYKLKTA